MDEKADIWGIELTVGSAPNRSEAISAALEAIVAGNPKVAMRSDREAGELLLLGWGELELDEVAGALVAEFGTEVRFGAPRIAYRETLNGHCEIDQTFTGTVEGRRSFARVKFAIRPGDRPVLEDRALPGTLPPDAFAGVSRGFHAVLRHGPGAGGRVTDLHAEILEAEANDRSSPEAFERATRFAICDALRRGGTTVLEPLMFLSIEIPERFTGAVVGDLTSRRGTVLKMEDQAGVTRLDAEAPLCNLFGYINNLRSMTDGAGNFTQSYSRYAPIPLPPGGPDDFRPATGMRA